jgi:chromosome segregation ATPase
MRPTIAESLRAIQSAIAEQLTPELTSLFAIESASAASMLVESLYAEWDTLAEDLRADNARLREILGVSRAALHSIDRSNEVTTALVSKIDGVLAQAGDDRLAISSLRSASDQLSDALADLLELIEDTQGQPGTESLSPVRAQAYRHLRRVAVRGWSYLDISGFRERIIKAREELESDNSAVER